MDTNKFNNYRLNKIKEISKNLNKIKILQEGGQYSKLSIDKKFDGLKNKINSFKTRMEEEAKKSVEADILDKQTQIKELEKEKTDLEYNKDIIVQKLTAAEELRDKIKDENIRLESKNANSQQEITAKQKELQQKEEVIGHLKDQLQQSDVNIKLNNNMLNDILFQLNALS